MEEPSVSHHYFHICLVIFMLIPLFSQMGNWSLERCDDFPKVVHPDPLPHHLPPGRQVLPAASPSQAAPQPVLST